MRIEPVIVHGHLCVVTVIVVVIVSMLVGKREREREGKEALTSVLQKGEGLKRWWMSQDEKSINCKWKFQNRKFLNNDLN